MTEYLVDRAYQLNDRLKYDTKYCEAEALEVLLEDYSAQLIVDSTTQRAEEGYVRLVGFELNNTNYAVKVNNKTVITATFTPKNATNRKLTYSSSDPSIFTVSQYGVIVGNAVGSADLTVTSEENPELTLTVKVDVVREGSAVQTEFSLGMLSNVDASVDDAASGTLLVKDGDTYTMANYTDAVQLNLDSSNDELWNTINTTYPSVYTVTSPTIVNKYLADITKTKSQIQIRYTIGLKTNTVDLVMVDGVVYRSDHYLEYVE